MYGMCMWLLSIFGAFSGKIFAQGAVLALGLVRRVLSTVALYFSEKRLYAETAWDLETDMQRVFLSQQLHLSSAKRGREQQERRRKEEEEGGKEDEEDPEKSCHQRRPPPLLSETSRPHEGTENTKVNSL